MSTDFKLDARVKFLRRNGQEAKGRVAGPAKQGGRGVYIPVNTGTKEAPDVTYVRPGQLTKF